MTKVGPVHGWALDRILELDRHCPGVAGSFLRASSERRQIVASLLASEKNRNLNAPVRAMSENERARIINQADHHTILVAGYGAPPEGMRGALGRAGSEPHAPRFYGYLYHLLATPRCRPFAATIAQMPRVNMSRLRIARHLPAALQTPSLISAIENVETAKDISLLAALMVSNGINRDSLFGALRQVTHRRQIAKFWSRWCLKTVFPTQPVAGSPFVRPVASAAELRSIALKYHNCAERYVSDVLEGRAAFCEFVREGSGLIMHLRRNGDRWLIESVNVKYNGPVPRNARAAAVQHFAELGIFERARHRPMRGDWSAMRRLTAYCDFDDDYDED